MPLDRAQIEEDAARVKRGVDGFEMDFERAGAPLLEVVGACIQMSPDQAAASAKSLWRESIHCAARLGLIEEGWFKTDINISIKPKGVAGLGSRVEVKGVGSFEFCKVAAEDRMWALAEELLGMAPRPVRTMGFDEVKMVCIPMREKGQDHAYKFLPDGDLASCEACEIDERFEGWREIVRRLSRIDMHLAVELGEDPRKTRVLSMASSAFWGELDRKPEGFTAQALRAFFEKMDASLWRSNPSGAAKALQWLVASIDAKGIGRALRSLQGSIGSDGCFDLDGASRDLVEGQHALVDRLEQLAPLLGELLSGDAKEREAWRQAGEGKAKAMGYVYGRLAASAAKVGLRVDPKDLSEWLDSKVGT